jgi:DNA-binding transcriptional MocR family regulator
VKYVGWEARQWATKHYGLSPRAKAVLLCIAEFHNPKAGYAWPSQQRIAAETGYSLRTVKRAVADLRALGLIVVAKQTLAFMDDYAPNRYYLVGHSPNLPEPGKIYQSGAWFNSEGKHEADFNEWDPT